MGIKRRPALCTLFQCTMSDNIILSNKNSPASTSLCADALIEAWLQFKRSKSNSAHTERAYRLALGRWRSFLVCIYGIDIFQAAEAHVRQWQEELRGAGLSNTTINHALACVSSFYTFVQKEGVDIKNPCKANIFRTNITPYAAARPLSIAEYDRLLTHLEKNAVTLSGARAHALLRTYLHTGWRSTELLRMRWSDLRQHRSQLGAYVYAWRGKGAKRQDDVLPADCAAAIVYYLKCDKRWPPSHDDYIFRPIRPSTRGAPLSSQTALRILRKALKQAGVEHPERFRIHDLRHTHAHLLLAAGHDLTVIQARLHHSSLATTGVYTRIVFREDPEDFFSESFRKLRTERTEL